jgi:hypothetical protein
MAKQFEGDLLSLNLDPDRIKRFEIDLSKGVLRADGPEDHQRMMEALEVLKSTAKTPIESIAVPSVVEPTTQKGLKVLDLLDKFFLLKSRLKPATVLAYKNTMEEFRTFLKNPFIQNIGVSDITRYQEHLAKNKKNTPRTIDNKVATIRALFNYAIKQGYYFEKILLRIEPSSRKKKKLVVVGP